MSEQHTPGRLVAVHEVLLLDDGGGEFLDVATLVGNLNAEANARRLVACWNACEGVPTELLEAYPAPFTELRTQRDELLAALEMARNGLVWYQYTYPETKDGSDDEAMAKIDAAIVKATGEQP